MFHNCSCVEENGFQSKNNSMKLGECPKSDDCKRKFYIYIVVQILTLFSAALGSTSNIMLIFKWVWLLKRGLASLVSQRVKHLPAVQETWVRSLGWEDPLEKKMATHSSILAWRIPWTEEPGGLQSMGSQRVGDDWATSLMYISW